MNTLHAKMLMSEALDCPGCVQLFCFSMEGQTVVCARGQGSDQIPRCFVARSHNEMLPCVFLPVSLSLASVSPYKLTLVSAR